MWVVTGSIPVGMEEEAPFGFEGGDTRFAHRFASLAHENVSDLQTTVIILSGRRFLNRRFSEIALHEPLADIKVTKVTRVTGQFVGLSQPANSVLGTIYFAIRVISFTTVKVAAIATFVHSKCRHLYRCPFMRSRSDALRANDRSLIKILIF